MPSTVLRKGPNELVEALHKSPFRIFLAQFTNSLIIILLVAAVISAAIGIHQDSVEELYDAVVIMVIVILDAIRTFEPKGERGESYGDGKAGEKISRIIGEELA